MISLTLNCLNNSKINGLRVINKNLIYIGADYTCDIFTPGKDIENIHIFIEIFNSKLLVHLSDNVDSIKVAGKKTTSVRFFKVNDKIEFGDYELVINEFKFKEIPKAKDHINKLTEELLQKGGTDLELLKDIQENE